MQIITNEEKKIIDQYSNIDSSNFRTQILSIIKNWKIDVNRKYDFIVNNEAFNWKKLAVYIIDNLKLDGEMYDLAINWVLKPHLFATLSENNFKNLIGFEKYTSHLSYLYGIIIERCLITFVEQELHKRQISYGNFLKFKKDDAFLKIYGYSFDEMFKEFIRNNENKTNNFYETDDENFTYWCFKKRVEVSEPSKLASDTKKGTMFLYKLLESESKRINLSKSTKTSTKNKVDFVF
ncbi:MAG: hypothetical protein GWO78_01140 [Dehalococcoidales bacterium]|nr:hypothetical protein [Dehalococcoidales bacterium]